MSRFQGFFSHINASGININLVVKKVEVNNLGLSFANKVEEVRRVHGVPRDKKNWINNVCIVPAFSSTSIYTQTIKLCPLDVYVCHFQMYERKSFKFSPYKV